MSDTSVYGSDVDDEEDRYSNESTYSAGFTTGTEGEESDIFGDDFDAIDTLRSMEAQHPANATGLQPYQVLTRRTARLAEQDDDFDGTGGRSTSDQATFGADMDEMMDPNLIEELGLSGKRRRGRRRRRKKGKKRREVPEYVVKMLGEANLLYATEGYEKSHTLLLEVVRLAPNWADPWHTMGLLYEAVGDSRKALNVYMIAAHLTKKDAGFWKRLATMSVELGFLHQAVYCFTKALHRDKADIDLRFDRGVLYAELGHTKKAIEELQEVQNHDPLHPQVPVNLARLYHRTKQPDKAITVLKQHLLASKENMDLTHVNILAELYIEQGAFDDCLTIIKKSQEIACAGEALPPDLTMKAGLCQLQLGNVEAANEHLLPLLQEPVQHFADLYLEAGMAYLHAKQHTLALEYFERLMIAPEYYTPTLWSSMATCYTAIDARPKAIAMYEAHLNQIPPEHPYYVQVIVSLAELLTEAQEKDKVRELLLKMDELMESCSAVLQMDATQRAALLSRRQALYLSLGDTSMFINMLLPSITDTLTAMEATQQTTSTKNLPIELRRALQRRERRLASGKKPAKPDESMEMFQAGQSRDRRKQHVIALDAQVEQMMAEQSDAEVPGQGANSLFANEQSFEMFLQCCKALVASGRPLEAKQLLHRAIRVCKSGKGNTRHYRLRMRMVLTEALAAVNELPAAVICLSQVISRDGDNREAWNLFCRLFNHSGTMRQWTRFVQNVRTRNPSLLAPAIMQGHSFLLKRHYPQALTEYLVALKAAPKEPLLLLCCGVAYHGMAASRNLPDRHRAVLTGFAFFQEYSRARDLPQEGFYNLARAAHGLGLLYVAEELYRKALAAPPAKAPPRKGEEAEVPDSSLDLRREAAFNLHLIYRSSGADELARVVLKEHFVV